MKRYFTLSIFVAFSFSNAFAQKKVIVADSISRQVLSFAEVQFANTGFYTDKYGGAILYDTTLYRISYLGHETLIVNPKTLSKDTLYLKHKPVFLEEFTFQAYPNTKKVDFLTIPNKNYSGFPMKRSREIVARIYPENVIIGLLKNISFSFEKDIFKKPFVNYKSKAIVRFNLYSNDSVLTPIYSSKVIEIEGDASQQVLLDLSEERIQLNEMGIAVGIEYLGYIDAKGAFLANESVIYVSLTSERSPLYKQNTLIRSVFDDKSIIINSLEEYFNSGNPQNYKGDTRNLAIAFELFTKE